MIKMGLEWVLWKIKMWIVSSFKKKRKIDQNKAREKREQ